MSNNENIEVKKNLTEVNLNDERFVENNIDFESGTRKKPGFYFLPKKLVISPAQTLGANCSLMLEAESMKKILQECNFVNPSQSTLVEKFPEIGQRTPIKSRISGIHNGWENPKITADDHLEEIKIFAFNCLIDQSGIHMDENSLMSICDGAGRATALLQDDEGIAHSRGIKFLLNINISGSKMQMLKAFLKQGDAKRLSPGTNLGVSSAMLAMSEEEDLPSTINDRHYATYVVKELFNKHREGWFAVAGVKTEGGSVRGAKKCDMRSIATSIGFFKTQIQNADLKADQLVKILSTTFGWFWNNCPHARRDVMENNGRLHHFHSVLACKFMMLMSIKIFPHCKGSLTTFSQHVEEVLKAYRNTNQQHFHIKKGKSPGRITADYLFLNHFGFTGPEGKLALFNSGAAASAWLKNLEGSINNFYSKG